MAFEQPVHKIAALKAGGDLSAASAQFRAVKISAVNSVVLAGAGEFGIGILQEPVASGISAEVMALGISKAEIGTGGATAGDKLQADAAGALVAASTAGHPLAVALDTVAAGELGSVLLMPSAVPLA